MKTLVFAALMGILAFAITAYADIDTTDISMDTIYSWDSLHSVLRSKFGQVNTDITSVSGSSNLGTGHVYYVDSAVGSDTYTGTKPELATATVDAAVALCTANNGDYVYIMPGHTESWTTTDSADLDVAGVTYICLGTGTDTPTFTFADTDGELVVAAANVHWVGGKFLPSITGVVHAVEIEADADGSVIDSVWFANGEASGTDEFVDAIQFTTAADNITVRNCRFESYGGAGANTGLDLTAGVVEDLKVVGNYFNGDYAEAPIYSDNDVHLRAYIADNVTFNTNSGDYGIEFGGAATGLCLYNSIYTDALATSLDPGSLACIENYAINTVDLSAIKVPVVPAISALAVTAGSADNILAKLYYTSDGTGAYPATLANDSLLAMLMCKGSTATPSTFSNTTDSLEMLSDKLGAFSGDEGANADDSVKALLDLAHTDIDGILSDTALWDTASELQAVIYGSAGIGASDANMRAQVTAADVNMRAQMYIHDVNMEADITAHDVNMRAQMYAHDVNMTNVSEKCISKVITTISNGANNLFAVTGGPIKLTEIVTYVTTTNIGSEGCLVGYNVDPTTPDTDTVFGTDGIAYEANGAVVGTAFIWDGVLGADLTAQANGVFVAMGTDISYGLIIPPGMIELTATVGAPPITGELTVYMRYIPLSTASLVTAQ